MLVSECGVSALRSWEVSLSSLVILHFISPQLLALTTSSTGEPACSVTPVMLSWYQHFLPLFETSKLGQVKTMCALRGNESLGDRA